VHMDGMWANYQQPWCGIGFNTGALKKVGNWTELWDKKYARRIVVPSLQNTEGVWTLFFAAALATGKPLAEAQYEVGAAFEKLKSLKPNLLTVYTQMPAAFNLLEQGEAAMLAGAFSEFTIPRKLAGSPVELAAPAEGVGVMPSGIALVKGGPQQELANAFVNEMLGPEFQAAMIKETFALPTSTKAAASDIVPANIPVFAPDWANVVKNRQTWIERFDREIAS
jgi:putative spermidine/putrescine transport system substrate-binding protein